MLLSKRCPKCGGNLIVGSDYYGRYATCMQCGRALDLPSDCHRDEERVAEVTGAGSSRGKEPALRATKEPALRAAKEPALRAAKEPALRAAKGRPRL